MTVERFIDKYVPLRVQSMISETLNSTLNSHQLNRLEQFELEKFAELNEDVLSESQTNMPEEMKKLLEKLIEIDKKNDAKGVKGYKGQVRKNISSNPQNSWKIKGDSKDTSSKNESLLLSKEQSIDGYKPRASTKIDQHKHTIFQEE